MSRKVKSVSFQLDDPYEKELLEYSKQFSNFSTFVKRLIQDSMSKRSPNMTIAASPIKPVQSIKSPINQRPIDKNLINHYL